MRYYFVFKRNLQIEENNRFNIIFLDIDGVLSKDPLCDKAHQNRLRINKISDLRHCKEITEKFSPSFLSTFSDDELFSLSKAMAFAKDAVRHLLDLCEEFNAKIVVSSSWREGNTIEQLKKIFSIWKFDQYIIDCTPQIEEKYRGREISAWLEKNIDQVHAFVILDDQKYDIQYTFSNRFILCNTLFSDESLYEEAKKILKKPYIPDNKPKILNDMTCLKFRLAIVEDKISIRIKEKNPSLIDDVEMAIHGTEEDSASWINMHHFLMSNDWDTTLTGAYSEISYEEQRALTIYVSDSSDYPKMKALFYRYNRIDIYNICEKNNGFMINKLIQVEINTDNNNNNNNSEENKFPDSSNKFSYSSSNSSSIEAKDFDSTKTCYESSSNSSQLIKENIKKYIFLYLKQLILMQSAYNKKRFSPSNASKKEVYRNVDDLCNEIEISKQCDSLVNFFSIASTSTDRSLLRNRKYKFIIEAGNDAVPLTDIIVDDYLCKYITAVEKEKFLGVRPFFIKKDKNDLASSTFQTKHLLHHINQTDMKNCRVIQRFFREKIKINQINEKKQIVEGKRNDRNLKH
jgi:hypothetical protein